MADYGVGISKQGYNVTSNLTIDLMVFKSNTFLFKGYTTGTASASVSGVGSTSVSVAHSLGYRPAIKAYWSTDNANWHPAGLTNSPLSDQILFVGATSSNIVLDVLNYVAGSVTVYIHWVAYVDNLG